VACAQAERASLQELQKTSGDREAVLRKREEAAAAAEAKAADAQEKAKEALERAKALEKEAHDKVQTNGICNVHHVLHHISGCLRQCPSYTARQWWLCTA
jgi:ElaB/YqjD/DUF883 family membrane-anchored ribosome-binding protein